MDILENNSTYLFKADVPGLKASEVQVVCLGEMLVISGERGPGCGQKFLRQERPQGRFCRRIPLPANAGREQIKARLLEGVLQVSVRKLPTGQAEKDHAERLEITLNG